VNASSAWCPWCGERVYTAIPWKPILIISGVILVLTLLITFLVLTGNG
jgi:hypothetical protein